MSTKKKVALIVLIAVIAVPTGYFAVQFWNVVAFHEYRKGLVVQARLIDLQYMLNPFSIENGYFTCYLTFTNPSSETLTLNKLYVNYWESPLRWQQYLIASGVGKTVENISPGTTTISIIMELNPEYTGNILLVQQPLWDVGYTPKLGSTAYAIRAYVQNSTIETEGPFYALEIDETESTLTAYMMSIIDVWGHSIRNFSRCHHFPK